MKEQDEASFISNPRLLAAIYFSLLAIIATVFIDTVLYALGVGQFLPIFKAIILSVITSAIFGALFGKRIVHACKPYKLRAFWYGFLMVIVALPFYNLGFMLFLQVHQPNIYDTASWMGLINMYLFVLFYGFILAGLWLAILSGFASMYLRGKLVYYILDSLNVERNMPKKESDVIKNKIVKH